MSMSNAFETLLLQCLLQNANIANLGDATGVRGSTVAGSLYISLHTADPGEAGNQGTSEATYTGYTRVAVARSAAGWTVTGPVGSNAAIVTFPSATAGSNVITYVGIGTDSSGAGTLLFSGALSASITISTANPTPQAAIGGITVTLD